MATLNLFNVLAKLLPADVYVRLPGQLPKRKRQNPLVRVWRRLFPLRMSADERAGISTEITAAPASPAAPRRGWLWQLLFPRKLTPAERAEQRALALREKLARRHRMELLREAANYAKQISHTLDNQGISHTRTKNNHTYKDTIKFFRPYDVADDALHLRVNTDPHHFPHGINLDMLREPHVLELLSKNCRDKDGRPHFVRCTPPEAKHFCFTIEREAGAGGIPAHVRLADMLATRPAHLSDPMVVPIGIGSHDKDFWISPRHDTNWLICSTPKYGKSNMVNVIICCSILYNPPEKLQLILVDLKGGMEFGFYENVPHLAQVPRLRVRIKKPKKNADATNPKQDDVIEPEIEVTPIPDTGNEDYIDIEEPEYVGVGDWDKTYPALIYDRGDVPGVMFWCKWESERRMNLFRTAGAKSIDVYNRMMRRRGEPEIPIIYVIIDELADTKVNRRAGKVSEDLLTNNTNRSRATGVHYIVATQSPNSSVVNGSILNALPARLVLHLANQYISQSIVGDYSARYLPIPGRAIYTDGSSSRELQVPFISDEMVREIVANVCAGKTMHIKPESHDVTDQEIYEWSLANNIGHLISRDIWMHFKSRGFSARSAERFCKQSEGKIINIDGMDYQVMPGIGRFPNQQPRRLLPVQKTIESQVNNGISN